MAYGYGPNAPSICADEYEFHCSAPDCVEHSHEQEDFLKCEACAGLICSEHAHRVTADDIPFCDMCFRCTCGHDAEFACDRCGELRCAEHGYAYDGGEEREYLCQGCYPQPLRLSDNRLLLSEQNSFRRAARKRPVQEAVLAGEYGVA